MRRQTNEWMQFICMDWVNISPHLCVFNVAFCVICIYIWMQLMQTNERLFISCKGFESDDVKSMHRRKKTIQKYLLFMKEKTFHMIYEHRIKTVLF